MQDLDYWIGLFEKIHLVGPILPIGLAFIEALLPFLPMVGIITFNVAAHGAWLGFLYTWIGSCIGCITVFFIFRKIGERLLKDKKAAVGKISKVNGFITNLDTGALFVLMVLPFTPSSFVNVIVGLSDRDSKEFITCLCLTKFGMLGSLAFIGSSLLEIGQHPFKAVIGIILFIGLYFAGKVITGRLKKQS